MLQSVEILLPPILELIQYHLTAALCQQVFHSERVNERERLWTLEAMVMFWNEVILRAPASLTQALQECFGGNWTNAHVKASPEAFFQKSQNLSPRFFKRLFHEFMKRLAPEAPTNYGKDVASLLSSYEDVWIIDGSRLAAVWKRLKILQNLKAAVLPGCLTVAYDLFRGIPRIVEFYPDAAISESQRACEFLKEIPKGILLMGDRLYGIPSIMDAAIKKGFNILARYNATVKLMPVKILSKKKYKGGVLIDELVDAGGSQNVPHVRMRHIYWKKGDTIRRLVTTELDPNRLTAKMALKLYPFRWSIERMFYDLKEVLGLNNICCANPNGVAQQVYACCIVYSAMRVIQAETALKCEGILPEDISEKKFFVKIAVAHMEYIYSLIAFLLIRVANPNVDLKEPDWSKLKSARVFLRDILREKRNPIRRKKDFCKERRKWTSFKHVENADKFFKN
jgi:hypothetical protein